jgi:tRNA-binding protein
MTVSFDEFTKIEIRVGTIVAAERFPEARRPALKLTIDFGSKLGLKRSSAQLTRHYDATSIIGRQIAAVVNFPPKQIGKFISQVLVLGFPDAEGAVVLIGPERPVPNGSRLF